MMCVCIHTYAYTLLQALAEFSSYCDSQPVSELKCGLSIWPLMFNKLCTVRNSFCDSRRFLKRHCIVNLLMVDDFNFEVFSQNF